MEYTIKSSSPAFRSNQNPSPESRFLKKNVEEKRPNFQNIMDRREGGRNCVWLCFCLRAAVLLRSVSRYTRDTGKCVRYIYGATLFRGVSRISRIHIIDLMPRPGTRCESSNPRSWDLSCIFLKN